MGHPAPLDAQTRATTLDQLYSTLLLLHIGAALAPGSRRIAIIGTVTKKLKSEDPREPALKERDLAMMRRALEEAAQAAEQGEVPVGAIVARGEEVIATAHNEREATRDPTAHAELLALRRASRKLKTWRLNDCTLYATLEPCPMCAGALHASRISRLVYAAPDPKAGAAGTLYDLPTDPRLNHTYPYTPGVLQDESASLLRAFFEQRRRKPKSPRDYLPKET